MKNTLTTSLLALAIDISKALTAGTLVVGIGSAIAAPPQISQKSSCGLTAEPGTYELQVPVNYTVDVCAKDGLKIKHIASIAEKAGWKTTQMDGAFHIAAWPGAQPSNLIVRFEDGKRAEYRLTMTPSGKVALKVVED